MLITTITYNDKNHSLVNIDGISATRKKTPEHYVIEHNGQTLGSIYLKNESVHVEFEENLTLEAFTIIHHIILEISNKVNGQVDDTHSQLGYLKDGEPAFIITNWEKWYAFLNEAKLKTLEGQKVHVFDEEDELGSGILMEYQLEPSINEEFIINQCTLITTFGERKFSGKNLKIEPANEW